MNKKTVLTSLTAAALAGVFLTGANVSENVKAAVKPNGETAKAKNSEENAQDNVNSAQKEVDNAQQNVNSAKVNLNSAQSNAEGSDAAYSAQKAKTDIAQKNEADKKAALDKATDAQKQAQQLVNDSKDPAKVKQANDDVTAKSSALDTAKKEQTAADKNVSDQDAQVKQAQNQVNDLTKTRDDKQNAKTDADQQVKNAEDALKGTGITEAKNAVDTYQKNVEGLNKNIQDNQGILKQNQDVLKQNQDKLTPADASLDNAKTAAQNANQKLEADKTILNEKNNALSRAMQEAQSAAGFFKSLAEDSSLTAEQRQDAQQAYDIVMNNGRYHDFTDDDGEYQNIKLTWYDPSKQLGKDGDATSLTNMKAALDDLDELAKVRHEYGLELPKISLTATAIAMMSSDFQLISSEGGHPINMTQKYGPFFDDEEDIAEGTDDPYFGPDGEQVRQYMAEKQYIDDAIAKNPALQKYAYDNGPLTMSKWKTNTDFWNTQDNIGEIGHYTSMINPAQNSLGAARVSGLMQGIYDGAASIDILQSQIDDTDSYEHGPMSFTIDQYKNLVNNYVANPDKASFVQTAQKAVNDAQNVVNDDQSYLNKLQNAQDSAQSTVDALNKAISDTQKAISDTNKQINDDQTELSKQKSNLSQAQDRLKALTASQDQKVKNFNTAVTNQKSAENALTEAQSNLDKATNALNTVKDKLENLQTVAKTKAEAVKKVQDELTVAQKRVEDLKNAPQILAQANDAQAKAQKEYDAAKKAADEAQAQLNKLESAKSTADAQVSTAQAEYDTALANLKAAEDKLANAKKALEQIKQSEALLDQTSTTSTESSSEFKRIRLTHNAYVYTKAFKVVKYKNHKNIVLKKGHYIKAWNKGKIVTIKGKKFYQIGKNRFVKVANTVNKKAKKNYVLATVKGRKNHKVRVYLANGKFAKKYVYGQKAYKLAEKKTIKGKTYYRIYGKNLWVRASKIELKK